MKSTKVQTLGARRTRGNATPYALMGWVLAAVVVLLAFRGKSAMGLTTQVDSGLGIARLYANPPLQHLMPLLYCKQAQSGRCIICILARSPDFHAITFERSTFTKITI